MEGFVKNKSIEWAYAMKRSVRPGGEIPLSELFEQYGKKHGITQGEPFIEWLTEVKLRDKSQWEIVYDFGDDAKKKVEVPVEQPITKTTSDDINSPAAIKGLTVDDVVQLTVRKARNVLPRVVDLQMLKYALSEARQLSDKDSLCRLLQKRIKELQIAR